MQTQTINLIVPRGWHNSDTAKLFSPPKFENKKENKGYWF